MRIQIRSTVALSLLLLSLSPAAHASKALSVCAISNLQFGRIIQGDLARVVSAGGGDTPENASFQVTGEADRAYAIILPVGALLFAPGGILNVTHFQSFPPAGANGLIMPDGMQNLFVGATLQAVPMNQAAGTYTGAFLVTVVY